MAYDNQKMRNINTKHMKPTFVETTLVGFGVILGSVSISQFNIEPMYVTLGGFFGIFVIQGLRLAIISIIKSEISTNK